MSRLELQYKIKKDLKLSKKDLDERSYKLFIDIQGYLQLKFGNLEYYEEEYNCLLELGVSLQQWLRDKTKSKDDFYYYSMDHDDEAIFEFRYINDGNWKIYSPWHISNLEIILNDETINKVIQEFINNLNIDLRNRFGITTDDFLK